MKLPNADEAIVAREKIEDYLLNPAHPDNGGKAEFFTGLGFRRSGWGVLAAALKSLAKAGDVTDSSRTAHGVKYILIGKIQSPGGKSPLVQSIWIVDKGQNVARLVTAYPHQA